MISFLNRKTKLVKTKYILILFYRRRHPPSHGHFAQSRVDSTENIEGEQHHEVAEADYVDPTIQTNFGDVVHHES